MGRRRQGLAHSEVSTFRERSGALSPSDTFTKGVRLDVYRRHLRNVGLQVPQHRLKWSGMFLLLFFRPSSFVHAGTGLFASEPLDCVRAHIHAGPPVSSVGHLPLAESTIAVCRPRFSLMPQTTSVTARQLQCDLPPEMAYCAKSQRSRDTLTWRDAEVPTTARGEENHLTHGFANISHPTTQVQKNSLR